MALITLLRHAPLASKYQRCYNGHIDLEIDNSLINLEQQETLRKVKNQNYDLVFSSDLKRCTQTLDLIHFSYKTDNRLREVKFKDIFEGKSFDEISKMDIYDKKHLTSFITWHNFISSESIKDYKNRVISFLEELPKNKNILICSHGGTIKLLHSILKNERYEESLLKIEYCEFIDLNT